MGNEGEYSSKSGAEEPQPDVEFEFQSADVHRPKNPRRKAKYNLISRLFFLWLDSLFLTGCRRELAQTDLYAHPDEVDSEKLLHRFEGHWRAECERRRNGRKARLWMALYKCIWWRFTISGVLQFLEIVVMTSQSLLVGQLADYFATCTTQTAQNAYLYALGLVLCGFLISMIHGHGFLTGYMVGMITRVTATSAIYQKVVRLSQVTVGRLSIGHIVNLASNDVQRFEHAFLFANFLWIGPLHLCVVTYLVYREVGPAAFIATGFVLLLVPLQTLFARAFSYLRLKSARLTDQRIKVMNEVITGIRVIKMYGWEHAFRRVVANLRRKESRLILFAGLIRAGLYGFDLVFHIVVLFVTFSVYASTGGEVTSRKVFTTLSLTLLLRLTSVFFFVNATLTISEGTVAIKRLQKFLEMDEVHATIADHKYFKLSASDDSAVMTICDDLYRTHIWETSYPPHNSSLEGATKLKRTPFCSSYSALSDDAPPSVGAPVASSKQQIPGATNPKVSLEGYFRPESPWLPGSSVIRRSPSPPTITPADLPFARVDGLSASWSNDRDKMVLKDINFEVSGKHNVMAVIGSVGVGKSTLLQCLLGELKGMDGSVEVNGRVSYASQDPWVFSGTLRENVLFGLPFKQPWYSNVLEACALDQDVAQLINGDLTLVGERGVTLSGGQKARVNLARAVYRDADVYLLDDPLSAVDTAVAKHLFDVCIRGLLGDRVVVLVTHQLQFALQADKILAIKDGHEEVYGTMAELEERGIDPTELLRLMRSDDDESDQFAYSDSEDDEEFSDEPSSPVRLNGVTSPCLRRKRQRFDSQGEEGNSVYSAPSMLSIHSAVEAATSRHEDDENETFGPPEEEKAHGRITMKTYYRFFKAGGSFLGLTFVLLIFFLAEGGIVISDWWLADWARCNINQSTSSMDSVCSNTSTIVNQSIPSRCSFNTHERIATYSGIILASIILNFGRSIMLYFLCVNAARVLHNRMFASILRAPIRFFDTNPIGRVLNRFSKDIGFLDDLLPLTFLHYVTLLLRFLAIVTTAAAANAYIVIPVVFVIVVFLCLRWYYLKTSRDVKRLEAISRSPLYSHISATLQGLPTIRSFGKQNVAVDLFHNYQNEHSQGWYLYLVTARWFGIRIDMLSALFLGAVGFGSIPLASELDPGVVGLALAYTISLAGMFQFCVRQSAEVENLMISAERVMDYGHLDSESSLDTLAPNDKPPADWPDKGQITMDNVCFQYSSDLPLVLKDLTFSVQPAEKIGIVGRTGAGKSSLLSVLFRLAEPYGSITIDGVETKSLGLHDLRKNMSIIPQDPVLFSGTMRYNLDPFDDYSDAELWDVLEQVQLKEAVEQLEGRLEGEVSEGGSNFSVGQRQLVCLARALLRKNKILILDEATANVDVSTDSIIQATLREKFADCSVLTIAHRLNTIMDSDKILVMNKGQAKEFESPHRLLQNPSSQFSKMVDKTGPTAAQKLRDMAEDARMRKRGGGGGGGGRRRSSARKTSDAAIHFLVNSVPVIHESKDA